MGAGLTLLVLPPPLYANSYSIFTAARLWPNLDADTFPGPLHHAMRLGTVLPTKLAQVVFGETQVAWVVTSCLLLAVLTAGTFAAGRALFGKSWIGFAAVGILLINPVMTLVDFYSAVVSNGSGGLLPDSPGAGWYCLGVAATVVASHRAGRKQLLWLASAGLAYGLSYLTREFSAFMFTAIPVYFWLLKLPWRRIVVPAATMLACLAFELVHNAIVWGDPLARLTVAGEHHGVMARPLGFLFVASGFARIGMVDALCYVFAAAFLLTILGLLITRDRRFVLLLTWFASLWIPLSLLGGWLEPTEPSLRVQLARYWFAIYPPLLIGAFATIDAIVRRVRGTTARRVVAVGIAALICLVYVVPAAGSWPACTATATGGSCVPGCPSTTRST